MVSMRGTSLILLLIATIPPALIAVAHPATPGDAAPVDDHLAWVLSLFDGAAADLTVADVEARFDPAFLRLVPAEEVIATIRRLSEDYGPLALVEAQPARPGEHVGLYRAEAGGMVMIAFAVDRESGLITGFFITRVGPSVAFPAASPEASPVA
jgi:hypothetical protein